MRSVIKGVLPEKLRFYLSGSILSVGVVAGVVYAGSACLP